MNHFFIENLINSIASTVTDDKRAFRCEKFCMQAWNRPETF